MDRLFHALRPFIRGVVRHAVWVLLVALLFSGAGLYYATQLRIDTDFSNLIPESYPSVQALEKLRDTVGSESGAAVGIVSPSFEANKAFAEDFIDAVLEMRGDRTEPYFARVDYRRDTEFLEGNALYFATPAELNQLETYLESEIEDAKLEANPFYFDLGDEEEEPDSTGEQLASVYSQIVGTEYPISDDSTTMVLNVYPTGAQTNIGFIRDAYDAMEDLVDEMDPSSYHPEMEVVLAGRLLRQLTEVDFITRDVQRSFGAGVGTVLLMVVLYFLFKAYRARAGSTFSGSLLLREALRAPVLALVIALPLLMSLSWTFGTAFLTFGKLNLMTSTLGLVLFGLGIDFGIHFYARYTEERAAGKTVIEAAEDTFVGTGQAITVGALTTASALYILVLADFRGFSEFGFIAGTGILFALIAMTVVLPAFLSFLERVRLLNLGPQDDASVHEGYEARTIPGARGLVFGSLAVVVLALVLLPRVEFEYRFGELEPTYEAYNEKREVIRRVSDDSNKRNPAYIVVDNVADGPRVADVLRQRAAQDTLSPTILSVETLQERFPLTDSTRAQRLARIADIRDLLNDKFLQAETNEDLDRLRRSAQTTEPIELEEVPEFLRNRFASKDGDIGTFVMVYPSVGLSDGRQSIAFAEDVSQVTLDDGTVYYAGSTSLVAADMLSLMQQEAPWMVGATFLIVALLMWINFGSIRWGLLALLPLVVGVLWMLLVMELTGLKLNFYNLVVLPAVLGIGNDAGVHLVHRYREEGFGSIWTMLRSTGEHVAMGSLTTMVGFAGLLLSFHPGLETIGSLAVVGIGTTLLSALFFLPALLQWMEHKGWTRTLFESESTTA